MVTRRWREAGRRQCGVENLPAVDPEHEHRGSGNSIDISRHNKPKEKFPQK